MKRRSFFGSLLALALPAAPTGAVPKTTLLPGRYEWEAPVVCVIDDVIEDDIAIYAGGVTWVDRAYDDRLGAALANMDLPKQWGRS